MKVFEILTECKQLILVESDKSIGEVSEILLKDEKINCYSYTEVDYEPLEEHISYRV